MCQPDTQAGVELSSWRTWHIGRHLLGRLPRELYVSVEMSLASVVSKGFNRELCSPRLHHGVRQAGDRTPYGFSVNKSLIHGFLGIRGFAEKTLRSFALVFIVLLGRAWQGIHRDQSYTVLSGCKC